MSRSLRAVRVLSGVTAVVLATALGCADGTRGDRAPAVPGAEWQVRSFVDAFNAHDVEAMLALTTADVEWLAVDGKAISVEAAGADALRSGMRGYFEACESCRSELAAVMVAGSRVTTLEIARWTTDDGPQSQRGLAVYELVAGKIRRVYSFPVEE